MKNMQDQMENIQEQKKSIRKQVLTKRNSLEPAPLRKAGEDALKKISEMEEFQRAKAVMIYMDAKGEVPTGPLINHILATGKRLVLPLTGKDFRIIPYEILPDPKWKEENLTKSSFGILEPNPDTCSLVDPAIIDFIVIPGVAFDSFSNRMGYGKGCYDCFLPLLRPDAFKLGLAHKFQMVEAVPTGPNDFQLDAICVV